jgi:hypothetical protein
MAFDGSEATLGRSAAELQIPRTSCATEIKSPAMATGARRSQFPIYLPCAALPLHPWPGFYVGFPQTQIRFASVRRRTATANRRPRCKPCRSAGHSAVTRRRQGQHPSSPHSHRHRSSQFVANGRQAKET